MSKHLLGFPNKKERDDFLIAIVVILFFGWLMLRFVGCDKNGNLVANEVELEDIENQLGVKYKDSDGDGIYDHEDRCPSLFGLPVHHGCPSDKDSDGDGILDMDDDCPEEAGAKENEGCPRDRDHDGVDDMHDACPYRKGSIENKGCPETTDTDTDTDTGNTNAAVVAPPKQTDSDGDGIVDAEDKCPDLAGVAANNGCPADSDGDGVYDTLDKCPSEKGLAENNGCPSTETTPKDSDGDGIVDAEDNCPDLAGVAANNGCPADSDGDGVYDKDDKCPSRKGLATNDGCPEVEIEEEDAKTIETAIQAVRFHTGSARLRTSSKGILDEVVAILKKYPEYKLDIIGHTDNVGNDVGNLRLSEDRAEACAKYFVARGVNTSRISHSGKGEMEPIETNETREGRRINRRVEFNLRY